MNLHKLGFKRSIRRREWLIKLSTHTIVIRKGRLFYVHTPFDSPIDSIYTDDYDHFGKLWQSDSIIIYDLPQSIVNSFTNYLRKYEPENVDFEKLYKEIS